MDFDYDFYFHSSLHSRFFVEQRSGHGWKVPDDWPSAHGGRAQPGLFFSIWEQPKLLHLFWGTHCLFAMRHGFPPDRDRSPLCRWLDTQLSEELSAHNVCWLPAEELLLDDWATTWLTVDQDLPARFISLFGSGRERFPEAALSAAGYDAYTLRYLRSRAFLVEDAIDYTFGKRYAQGRDTPPDEALPVTWRENVTEYIGSEGAAAFHGLSMVAPLADLRIIVFSAP